MSIISALLGDHDRQRWMAALTLCLLAICGCTYAPVHIGSVNRSAVNRSEEQQVGRGIQVLRGLRFTASVPVVVETQEGAQHIMAAEVARKHSDEELRVGGQVGALIGLYPEGIDLKPATLKLLKSQVAGFYDPHAKELILVRGVVDIGFFNGAPEFGRSDSIGEMLLAHELTHALQDQHFGIEKMLAQAEDDGDRSLALKAVAEGDATLAGFAYVKGRMDESVLDSVLSRLAALPKTLERESANTPEALSAPLIFQYSQGVRFVGEAFRRGGWPAVDALYRNPPQSTRQIIEPALYFDHPVLPAQIHVAGYQKILRDWTKADEDTYGEVLLRVILERNLGKDAPQVRLAERWAGDRLLVLKKGNTLTVLWLLAMTDRGSAEAFATAYARILEQVLGARTQYRVGHKSDVVLVVIGPGASRFGELEPAIWKKSRIERAAPRAPLRVQASAPRALPPDLGG